MTHCMLSLDLPDADDDQRAYLYNVLDGDGWGRLLEVNTTAWVKQFDAGLLNPSIERRIISVVQDAADVARIRRVMFTFQIGNNEVRTGRTVKVPGGYETSLN